jgi:hypothetical protein
MPVSQSLLGAVLVQPPADAWRGISDHLWSEFSAPLPATAADAEVVRRDRALTELDNVLSGAAWDLWPHFDGAVPKASQGLLDFWNQAHGGKAVLILDGLSLREAPWVLAQAQGRGYKVHRAEVRGSEMPAESGYGLAGFSRPCVGSATLPGVLKGLNPFGVFCRGVDSGSGLICSLVPSGHDSAGLPGPGGGVKLLSDMVTAPYQVSLCSQAGTLRTSRPFDTSIAVVEAVVKMGSED